MSFPAFLRSIALVAIGITIGILGDRAVLHVTPPQPSTVVAAAAGASATAAATCTVAGDEPPKLANGVSSRPAHETPTAGEVTSETCRPESFSFAELKKAYEVKSQDISKNVVGAKFPFPKNELERNERLSSFQPEIINLAQESEAWIAEWSVQTSSGPVSLSIIWSVHEKRDGFGIEVFLPNKKQVLAMGTRLDYASPVGEYRYVVTDMTDKSVQEKILYFAFALPSVKSKTAPSEYLLPTEKSWRAGPTLNWKPLSEREAETFRKDAANRNKLDEAE